MKYSVAKIEDLKYTPHPELDLPPLWQVIYHEAIHGNHILFEKELVDFFEKDISKSEHSFSDEQTEHLVTSALILMSTTDFQKMRSLVKRLDY